VLSQGHLILYTFFFADFAGLDMVEQVFSDFLWLSVAALLTSSLPPWKFKITDRVSMCMQTARVWR